MQLNLESECPDLDHVETFNVSAEAQASVDREYIRFLEAKNAYLKDLCVRAWLSLAARSLNRAQRLLASKPALARLESLSGGGGELERWTRP